MHFGGHFSLAVHWSLLGRFSTSLRTDFLEGLGTSLATCDTFRKTLRHLWWQMSFPRANSEERFWLRWYFDAVPEDFLTAIHFWKALWLRWWLISSFEVPLNYSGLKASRRYWFIQIDGWGYGCFLTSVATWIIAGLGLGIPMATQFDVGGVPFSGELNWTILAKN